MICKYSSRYKESDSRGWQRLCCNITNQMCHAQYPCDRINNWTNHDNLTERCIVYNRQEEKQYMKQGEYKVLFEKRGYLIVEVDDTNAIMVKNELSEIPKYVDLVKFEGTYYIKGFEPKIEIEPKKLIETRTTTKKK